jgi:hypothetical protein
MKMKLITSVVSNIFFFGVVSFANSSTIISANSVSHNDFTTLIPAIHINDVINQNGLNTHYISGTTDWISYFAGNPTHDEAWTNKEWFGPQLSASGHSATDIHGSIDFDLGSVSRIDGLALWNEDSFGIGNFDIYTSTNGSSWTLVKGGNIPTNWPYDTHYSADLFNWTATDARFVRLTINAGGYKEPTDQYGVAIGEIAFSRTNPVPEPATITLIGIGLAGIFGGRFSRKKK